MSKNTSNVTFKYKNEIIEVATPTMGVVFAVAKTPRGALADPQILVSNPGQLEMYFGADNGTYPHMQYLKDILNEGGKLRISRILGATAAAATKEVVSGTDTYFVVSAKNMGAYGNDINIKVMPATDGDTDHFNLEVKDELVGTIELYENIDPSAEWGTAGPYTYLDKVIDNSTLVNIAYKDLTLVTTIPDLINANLAAGSDGSALAPADYEGSQANGTGVYAFDNYEDAFLLNFPGEDEDSMSGIDVKGMNYASDRADLMYIGSIPNVEATQADIVTFLQSKGSSRYTVFVGGGFKVQDGNSIVNIETSAAAVGFMARAQGEKGVWNSPAGTQAGTFRTGMGAVNNFGPQSRLSELNAIANAGGDMVVTKNGLTYIKDGYTMSQDSVDKYISVVMTDIYIRKLLLPLFEAALNKPNLPQTWADIYYACKPYLDQMVDDNAILSYGYKGDQFASDPSDYEVNLPADVAQGKYKVKLYIQTVAPMVEVEITIIKTLDSVTTV